MTMVALSVLTSTCQLKEITLEHAFVYCFSLSIAFVSSLYVLVPPNIRELERSDPRQIKWRVFAVTTVCVIATLLFPCLFCSIGEQATDSDDSSIPSAIQLVGWTSLNINAIQLVIGILLQAILLNTGSIVTCLLYTRHLCKWMRSTGKNVGYIQTYNVVYVEPLISAERWALIRNLIVAPLSEEAVFRGCMVPVLLASGMRPLQVVWIAPLFFGTAHCHHAWLVYKQGVPPPKVLLTTLFQFSYTTLFGAYSSFAFIRTSSIVAITVSHAFCNLMGLPDWGFLRKTGTRYSCLYSYRWLLVAIYLVGIVAFVWGFQSPFIMPPSPGLLVETVNEAVSPSMSSP